MPRETRDIPWSDVVNAGTADPVGPNSIANRLARQRKEASMTGPRASDPTATREAIVQTVMDWWDDGLFMYPDEEQAAGSLADAILTALAEADVCVVRRDDVEDYKRRIDRDVFHSGPDGYTALRARQDRLADALAASGEPGGGEG